MGGATLGPMKATCLVGECQGGEAGVGGCVREYPHRSRAGRYRGFVEGKPRKGIIFEI